MSRMIDGSERIADGTYVLVRERLPEVAYREARDYIGQVVGTDVDRSKYQVGARYYAGRGEWRFLDGGSWAFPWELVVIDEREALAEAASDEGLAAAQL